VTGLGLDDEEQRKEPNAWATSIFSAVRKTRAQLSPSLILSPQNQRLTGKTQQPAPGVKAAAQTSLSPPLLACHLRRQRRC